MKKRLTRLWPLIGLLAAGCEGYGPDSPDYYPRQNPPFTSPGTGYDSSAIKPQEQNASIVPRSPMLVASDQSWR